MMKVQKANLISDTGRLFPSNMPSFLCPRFLLLHLLPVVPAAPSLPRPTDVRPRVTYLEKVAKSYITNVLRKPHSCSPSPEKQVTNMEGIQTFLPYSRTYILIHFLSILSPGFTSGLEGAMAESLESGNLELPRSGFKLWLCCLLVVCF